jgi:acetyltransferase-like isoleucine patch superfamily enzyme
MAPEAQVNNFLAVTNSGHIWIEDFVFFGKNVSLITGTHDPARFEADRRDHFPREGRDIVIRRGAWIATNAIVIGPCVVGEHAVVGAGSVVTKDVPPYAIVCGNPARVVRSVRPAQSDSVTGSRTREHRDV